MISLRCSASRFGSRVWRVCSVVGVVLCVVLAWASPIDAAPVAPTPTTAADSARCLLNKTSATSGQLNCYVHTTAHNGEGRSSSWWTSGYTRTTSVAQSEAPGYQLLYLGTNGFPDGTTGVTVAQPTTLTKACIGPSSCTGTGFGSLPAWAISYSFSWSTPPANWTVGNVIESVNLRVNYQAGLDQSNHAIDTDVEIVEAEGPDLSGNFETFWPTDWFPAGSEGGPVPGPDGACDRVTWTWEQASDYVVSLSRPAGVQMDWAPGNHVLVYVKYPTSLLDFPQWDMPNPTFTYPTGSVEIPRGFVQLEDVWRRAQPGRIGQLPDFSTAVNTFTFDVRPWESFGKFFRASEIEFFCIHLDAIDGQSTGYIGYGDEPRELVPPESACSLVFIGRPAEVEPGGSATTEVFIFIDAEQEDPVTIEYWNPIAETWSEVLTDETFPQPWDPSIMVDSHDQEPGDLKFRCTDSEGTHGGGYWEGGPGFGGIISNEADKNCYTQSKFGLNPASWVPAAGRMGACLAEGLFVPDAEAIGAEWDETYTAMEEAVPFAWVVNAHGLVADASQGMATAIEESAEECYVWIGDGTGGTTVPESERGICPGELASGAGPLSSWSTFRDLLGKAVWIFWVLALGRVVLSPPTPPETITEENGQMAWNM